MACVDQSLVIMLMGGMFVAGGLVGAGLMLLVGTLSKTRGTKTTNASKEQDN